MLVWKNFVLSRGCWLLLASGLCFGGGEGEEAGSAGVLLLHEEAMVIEVVVLVVIWCIGDGGRRVDGLVCWWIMVGGGVDLLGELRHSLSGSSCRSSPGWRFRLVAGLDGW